MLSLKGFINYIALYQYITIIALIASVYFYMMYKRTFPFIIPFLSFNFLVEIVLVYYFSITIQNSLVVYNYFNIVVILYYFYIYYKYFEQKIWSKSIVIIAILWLMYVVFIFINYDILEKIHYHYLVGLIITVCLIFMQFKEILENRELVDLKRLPIFYFSLGILLFLFCALPILSFSKFLLIEDNRPLINRLIQFANIFLNLGYLGAVIWSGLNKKK
jgi:hypothetical protein